MPDVPEKQEPQGAQTQQPAAAQSPQAQSPQNVFHGIPAEIVEVEKRGKTGMYGEIYIVMCRVLEGRDKGRIIKRNILGPVRIGDIVRLTDTSREARQISVK
jgi:small subunit ribosomal protein S28e